MPTRCLYLLCGPSGVGKTTILNLLLEKGYTKARSCTTRPRRCNEPENAYYFLTEDAFVSRADMLTVARYDGNYYGIYPEELKTKDIHIMEPVGIRSLKRTYRERPFKVIGLTASVLELEERLRPRGPAGYSRLVSDFSAFADFDSLCDIVIQNSNLQLALQEVEAFIEKTEAA